MLTKKLNENITRKNVNMLMTIHILWHFSIGKLPESFHLRTDFYFNL